MSQGTDRIRMLNDQFRKNLTGGQAFVTPGIVALGYEAVQRLIQVLVTFDAFCLANDPHGEHDFGVFDFEGATVMFKIDYYDVKSEFASPDPTDPAVTKRVITLMLAEEY
jgi:uncharacterized protein DUF3768